jgi:hypothetical protein
VKQLRPASDIALLATSANVDQNEAGAAPAIFRLNGNDVLIVLSTNFQFGDWAGIVALTLKPFRIVIVIEVGVIRVLCRMAPSRISSYVRGNSR